MTSKSTTNIVVAIAMEAEAAPLIERLALVEDESFFPAPAPFRAYRGEHLDCALTVVTNGKDVAHGTGVDNVGTVPAALATYLALSSLDPAPRLVVNAGTCGGFGAMGAEIGDVFLTTAVANHDRRIPIPGFQEYGVGNLESAKMPGMAEEIGAKLGVCTTGNSLDATERDSEEMKKNGASVKDMEAAAIAWSCQMFGVDYLGLKVVTDIVDGDKPTAEEFMENLGTAAKSLQNALPKVVEHICSQGAAKDEL